LLVNYGPLGPSALRLAPLPPWNFRDASGDTFDEIRWEILNSF